MFGLGTKNIGIDLGTANTLVYMEGKGIVLREPSVVAKNTQTGEVIAVGSEAKEMIGRTPGTIVAIRPMKDGVIADYDTTAAMLKYFMEKTVGNSKPSVMVCVPSGVTEVEKRAVIDAARVAGAREAFVIEEPFAAAIGAGLPVMDPTGSMVVDIGGGTTDVAILSMGEIVTSQSLRYAGDRMNQAVISYIKNKHNLLIGSRTAEQIKIEIGSAFEPDEDEQVTVRGRDVVDGLPKQTTVTAPEIQKALEPGLMSIIAAAKEVLETTPPELSADIIDRGIMLTGGGALLKNIDKLISYYLQVPVLTADHPLEAVALGTGTLLKNIEKHQRH